MQNIDSRVFTEVGVSEELEGNCRQLQDLPLVGSGDGGKLVSGLVISSKLAG